MHLNCIPTDIQCTNLIRSPYKLSASMPDAAKYFTYSFVFFLEFEYVSVFGHLSLRNLLLPSTSWLFIRAYAFHSFSGGINPHASHSALRFSNNHTIPFGNRPMEVIYLALSFKVRTSLLVVGGIFPLKINDRNVPLIKGRFCVTVVRFLVFTVVSSVLKPISVVNELILGQLISLDV